MKVLMLIDGLAKGGKERRLLELLKGLHNQNEVEAELVLFSKKIDYKEVFNLDVKIHYLERKPKKDPRIFYRLYQLCKEISPDIIHSWGSMPSVYATPVAKVLGIKFINAMITNAPAHMKPFGKRAIRSKLTFPFSDVIVSNSLAGLDSYQVPTIKRRCLYNGFDFNRINNLIDPKEIRQKFNITTPYVAGMVGAFEDRKDYFTYISGALNLLEKRKDITFLAIGGGKNLEKCKQLVPSQFAPNILFTGMQNHVESIINLFDVGILITNHDVHGEGISNAIMEYMALGKPVIASDSGGTKEIVIDGETGWLIPPKAPDMLAEKIQWILDHQDQAIRMGQLGKQKVWADFNLENMVDKYLELYSSVLDLAPVQKANY